MPSFAPDSNALFRDTDVDETRFAFDLRNYEAAKANRASIYDRLVDRSMPCDEAWGTHWIALFRP